MGGYDLGLEGRGGVCSGLQGQSWAALNPKQSANSKLADAQVDLL